MSYAPKKKVATTGKITKPSKTKKAAAVVKPPVVKKPPDVLKAPATDAMSRFKRASARSVKRGVVRPPLLGKKEAKLAGGQTSYGSPFPTGLASLSSQRFALGQNPDAYTRDPQTTTAKRDFKKTSGKFPADYATNMKKLSRSDLADLSGSLKKLRTDKALKPKSSDDAKKTDRYQTTLAAVLHDSEPLRGNLAKEGRGAIAAIAEPNLKKRKALADAAEKDGVKKPKTLDGDDADLKRWQADVLHQAAPFTKPLGGSAHDELRSGKRKMTHSQEHIWEQGYVSDSSDEDKPDPFTMTERRKSAGLPALVFPTKTKVEDAVKQVIDDKAKAKAKKKKKAKTK